MGWRQDVEFFSKNRFNGSVWKRFSVFRGLVGRRNIYDFERRHHDQVSPYLGECDLRCCFRHFRSFSPIHQRHGPKGLGGTVSTTPEKTYRGKASIKKPPYLPKQKNFFYLGKGGFFNYFSFEFIF